ARALFAQPRAIHAFTPLRSTHAANLLRKPVKKSRVLSLATLPPLSTSLSTPPTYISGCCSTGMSRNTRHCRSAWLAPKPPIAPGDVLTTAQGFPCHALLPYGREPTSIAFFNAPGSDRLYSGV